jgi:two-component system, NtrC family, C4-dicarboxylate transport sensor histidine kinase DctB
VSCMSNVCNLRVSADKESVVLTLVNLLNNAVDALRGQTAPPPRVCIEAEPMPSNPALIRLSVIDNGPGLAETVLPLVSQPFFTTKGTGLGLGLTIARQALARMGASLHFSNEPQRGARFSVQIPQEPPAMGEC